MGINFYVHTMRTLDWMSRQYEADPGKHTDVETDLDDELAAGAIKFNDLMRDGVTAQLNQIMARGNREFTDEMLGRPEDDKKGILDVRA